MRFFELIDKPAAHAFVRPEAVLPMPIQPMKIMRREPLRAPSNGPAGNAAPSQQQPSKPDLTHREKEHEKARARIFDEPLESTKPEVRPFSLPSAEISVPIVPEASRKDRRGSVEWKVDAPEFDPFAGGTSPRSIRPIFTKPVINYATVPLPQHVILVRQLADPAAPNTSLQPLVAHLSKLLGDSWEIRTKPTHRDALLICASALQAESVLNDEKFRIPGFQIMVWKPRYYAEP